MTYLPASAARTDLERALPLIDDDAARAAVEGALTHTSKGTMREWMLEHDAQLVSTFQVRRRANGSLGDTWLPGPRTVDATSAKGSVFFGESAREYKGCVVAAVSPDTLVVASTWGDEHQLIAYWVSDRFGAAPAAEPELTVDLGHGTDVLTLLEPAPADLADGADSAVEGVTITLAATYADEWLVSRGARMGAEEVARAGARVTLTMPLEVLKRLHYSATSEGSPSAKRVVAAIDKSGLLPAA